MMKTFRMLAMAAALALCGVTSAHAGTKILATAPALAAYPALQTIYCDIINLNTTAATVTIDVMDYLGNVVTTGTVTIDSNNGQAVGDGTGTGSWCRFTVPGSPKKYRAMAIYDNASAYTVSVPAQ